MTETTAFVSSFLLRSHKFMTVKASLKIFTNENPMFLGGAPICWRLQWTYGVVSRADEGLGVALGNRLIHPRTPLLNSYPDEGRRPIPGHFPFLYRDARRRTDAIAATSSSVSPHLPPHLPPPTTSLLSQSRPFTRSVESRPLSPVAGSRAKRLYTRVQRLDGVPQSSQRTVSRGSSLTTPRPRPGAPRGLTRERPTVG